MKNTQPSQPNLSNLACFEVSWEIANAVGGIHTVLASKALEMMETYKNRYFVVGPWLKNNAAQEASWRDGVWDKEAEEALKILKTQGLSARMGYWKVPGEPPGILIDSSGLLASKDQLLAEYWERYALDSLFGDPDYIEPLLFGVAAGRAIKVLSKHWLDLHSTETLVHAHEWLAAGALLELRHSRPHTATVFTTHATALGRSLSSRASIPNKNLNFDEARNLAKESGVLPKHSLEYVASRVSDVFSTVSQTTALECEKLLGRKAQVLPNALDPEYPPRILESDSCRLRARKALLDLAQSITGVPYAQGGTEPLILLSSGRYEYRNKGLDLVVESLSRLKQDLPASSSAQASSPQVLAFFMVPADSSHQAPYGAGSRLLSHALNHPSNDALLSALEHFGFANESSDSVHVIWIPKFLDGSDAKVPFTYFELLAGADLTLFPSWYEPWGYTPMESIALGIPTISSDLAGFANWASSFGDIKTTGVYILPRRTQSFQESVEELGQLLKRALKAGREKISSLKIAALKLAMEGSWKKAINYYREAHSQAIEVSDKRFREECQPSNMDAAYFSMEFAIRSDLPIYSGGLGVLAGDFVKAAGDLGYRVCGVGLAYHEGHFRQSISEDLKQECKPEPTVFSEKVGMTPVLDSQGKTLILEIQIGKGQKIFSRAWKMIVGSSFLYLLDPDIELNPPEIRSLSRKLYTTDRRERWLQEYFLGTCGVKLLNTLGIRARWMQLNEGHTAILSLERAVSLKDKYYLSFDEAIQFLKKSMLFTTHTPVEAGFEEFEIDLVRPEIQVMADRLRISSKRLFDIGQTFSPEHGARLSLTAFAMALSSLVSAVSKRHLDVSKKLLRKFCRPDQRLLSVTNGVHPQTWIGPEWQNFFAKHLAKDWADRIDEESLWKRVLHIDPSEVWACHERSKQLLCQELKKQLAAKDIAESRRKALSLVSERLKPSTFISVFARRFTAYKRASLLFSDLPRLKKIIELYPNTLFLFAGKAHPADTGGQALISKVLELENSSEFRGHIAYLEGYDMKLAQFLTSGADIWMNFPQPPLEASGTSGMKAAMNGVLNFSVVDGWTAEANLDEVPWPVGVGWDNFSSPDMNWVHAEEIYTTLESSILPEYFDREAKTKIPDLWSKRIGKSIASSILRFSAQRMVQEYAAAMGWPQPLRLQSEKPRSEKLQKKQEKRVAQNPQRFATTQE